MIDSWQVAGWLVVIALSVLMFPRVIKGIVTLVIFHAILSNSRIREDMRPMREAKNEDGSDKFSQYELNEFMVQTAINLANRFLDWKNW